MSLEIILVLFQKPLVDKCMNYVPAIADWSGEDDSDLAFKAGDWVAVTAQTDADWWVGYVVDKPAVEGTFPANHVEAVLFCAHAIADWSGDVDGDLNFKTDDWILDNGVLYLVYPQF